MIGILEAKLGPNSKEYEKFINEVRKISNLSKRSGGQIENLSEVSWVRIVEYSYGTICFMLLSSKGYSSFNVVLLLSKCYGFHDVYMCIMVMRVIDLQVRMFVDAIVRVLLPALPMKLLLEAVDVLSTLFQEKHQNLYTSTAKKIIKQLSFSNSQGLSQVRNQNLSQSLSQNLGPGLKKRQGSSESSAPLQEGYSSQIARDLYPSSQPSIDISSQSSSLSAKDSSGITKRGHQMVKTMNTTKRQTTPSTSQITTNPEKDIFSALKNINIDKMKKKRESSAVSSTQQERVKKARLDCIVCSSHPTNPLINECGHICCEECW